MPYSDGLAQGISDFGTNFMKARQMKFEQEKQRQLLQAAILEQERKQAENDKAQKAATSLADIRSLNYGRWPGKKPTVTVGTAIETGMPGSNISGIVNLPGLEGQEVEREPTSKDFEEAEYESEQNLIKSDPNLFLKSLGVQRLERAEERYQKKEDRGGVKEGELTEKQSARVKFKERQIAALRIKSDNAMLEDDDEAIEKAENEIAMLEDEIRSIIGEPKTKSKGKGKVIKYDSQGRLINAR